MSGIFRDVFAARLKQEHIYIEDFLEVSYVKYHDQHVCRLPERF